MKIESGETRERLGYGGDYNHDFEPVIRFPFGSRVRREAHGGCTETRRCKPEQMYPEVKFPGLGFS